MCNVISPGLKRIGCMVASALCALGVSAGEIVVHPFHGDNGNPGTVDAPLRDISHALARARPGDTIRIVPVDAPVRAQFRVRNAGGAPGRPIVVDGGFNTFIGTAPIDPARWEEIEPGLFKAVKDVAPGLRSRYFMCFKGEMNRMGRRGKWPGAELKPVEELRAYEWTIVGDTDFYFRIPAGLTPEECGVEEPVLSSGVHITGDSSHWVFRNMIVKHFWNDGLNIHDNGRDILFENIAALFNGDDGVSAHGTSQITVRNYISIGNSTGICHINDAECRHENVYIAHTVGRDVYLLNRKNEFLNMVVEGAAPGGIEFTSDAREAGVVGETRLEDCLFASDEPGGRLVFTPKSRVTADRVSSFGYRPDPAFPEGWEDAAGEDEIRRSIRARKTELFALFDGRLSEE